MRFSTRRAVCFAFLIAATPAALAATWYVNGVSGSDTNNCLSPTTACKTIAHAISLASSGNSIMVAPATYTENLGIGVSMNVIGSGSGTTIIDGGEVGTVVTISNAKAQVTLSKITIRNGFAESSCNNGYYCPRFLGGGIYNSGALIINNSIISGNQAYSNCDPESPYTCSNVGGGIFNQGTVMIKDSTLSGNRAVTGCEFQLECPLGGGALLSSSRGTVTLTNSTVEGNRAAVCYGRSCSGTAIVNSLGNLVMNNSTVSGNSGGIFNVLGTVTLQNSILANNSGTNCRTTPTSHGYNLSSDTTCNFNGPGDMNDAKPMLGTLGNYGGPTPTIPLLAGSPAIDAGNPSGCTDGLGNLLKTDQRGMPRPNTEDKIGCDMGAYERQSD